MPLKISKLVSNALKNFCDISLHQKHTVQCYPLINQERNKNLKNLTEMIKKRANLGGKDSFFLGRYCGGSQIPKIYIFLLLVSIYLSELFFWTQSLNLWGSKNVDSCMESLTKTEVYLSLGDPALARFWEGGRFLSEEESAPRGLDPRAVIPRSRDRDRLLRKGGLDLEEFDEGARLSRPL